ncbi:MAG: PEP-CTERM sorting domain-containing protein [Pirellulales bacterium]|nr:PEP-CTERM sorting domain-containing protein [Pirellulales bacterium]
MKTVLLSTFCVFFASSVAIAENVWPPYWAGWARTAHAEWDTWTVDVSGYSSPDVWSSNPSLPFNPYAFFAGASVLEEFEGRTNVVELTGDLEVQFWLDNFEGGESKEVQIQITYYVDQDLDPQVFPGWYLPGGEEVVASELVDSTTHADGWVTDLWTITIEPNPSDEWFALFALDRDTNLQPFYPARVDQVVIDTWCVPEPSAMVLLAMGVLCAACRRRAVQA